MSIEQVLCHSRDRASRSLALPRREIVAPRWHTALLVLLVIGVAAVGTLQLGESGAQPRGASAAGSVWVAFLPLLAVEWMLVLWVARIARPANVLSDLVGARWGDARDVLVDLGWAARAAVAIMTLEVAAAHLLGSSRAPSVTAMLPHAAAERAGWVVVAIAVGFCEEVVYRG